MATKRSVILNGTPIVDEQDTAAAEVKPGYLVKRPIGGVEHQTASGTKAPFCIALERDELGAGIDNSLQGDGTSSAYYASGDRVKVAFCPPGTVVTAYIASGQNIQKDELLSSAGDGTLAAEATAEQAMAVSEEEVGAVTETTAIRVRVI